MHRKFFEEFATAAKDNLNMDKAMICKNIFAFSKFQTESTTSPSFETSQTKKKKKLEISLWPV